MTKSVEGQGLFIISDDPAYEFGVLDKFLTHTLSNFDNIIFVYSTNNDVSDLAVRELEKHGKRIFTVPFESYNTIKYASAIEALDLCRTIMVIKDLRYMLRRLDERLSMMQIKHSCYKKVVIDTLPFYVDTWKYYFPFSFFNKSLLGYSHSYAFEAAMRNYDNGIMKSDPCDPLELSKKTYECTFINYKKYFTFDISVEEYKVSESEQKKYDDLKEELFKTEKTPKAIISGLYKYSSSLVPGHNLPISLKKVYEWSSKRIVIIKKTNLKVDNYLYSEVCRLINTTNNLTESLYGD